MSSTQSGFTARRKLKFAEQPYRGTTFYLDIKAPSLKSRISERIQELGGEVECFLSRDVSLLITDNATKNGPGKDAPKGSALSAIQNNHQNIPLSRGQALLQKASKLHNPDHGSNQDLASVARTLGVKTETAATFLRSSAKHLAKAKAHSKGAGKGNDPMFGMSPISWEKEKETLCILKVEDTEQLYRPLFKQFDNPPKISYSETGSPFDVGAVLVKPGCTENNQKKYAGGALRGGYCESCDHWYKTILREHLNSDKHREFVSKIENFKSLESVAISLPKIGEFLVKHGLDRTSTIPNNGVLSNKENDANNNLVNTHIVSHGIQPTTYTMTASIPSNAGCEQTEHMEVDGMTNCASELSQIAKSDFIGNPRQVLLQKYRSKHNSSTDCLPHKPAAVCDVEMMSPHVAAVQMQHVGKTSQSTPLNLNQVSNPTSNVRQKLKYITIHDKAGPILTQPGAEKHSVQEILKGNGTNSAAGHDKTEEDAIPVDKSEKINDGQVCNPIENIPRVSAQSSASSRTCDYTPVDCDKLEGHVAPQICDKPTNQHTWLGIDHTTKPKDNGMQICNDLSGLVPEICFSSSGSSCSFSDKGVRNVISFLQNDTSSHGSVDNIHPNSVPASADMVNQRITEAMQYSTNSIIGTTVNSFVNFKPLQNDNILEEMDLKTGSSAGDRLPTLFLSVDDLQQNDIGNGAGLSAKQNVAVREDKSDKIDSKNIPRSHNMCNNSVSDKSMSEHSGVTSQILDRNSQGAERTIKDSLDTPTKPTHATNYLSNVFNSGSTCSTVRNWLLPPDSETCSQKATKCLDNTLTAGTDHRQDLSRNHVDVSPVHAAIPPQNPNLFVADWIEQQPFCSAGQTENDDTKSDIEQLAVNTVKENSLSASISDHGTDSNRIGETNKSHSLVSSTEDTHMPTGDENVFALKTTDVQAQDQEKTAAGNLVLNEINNMNTTVASPHVTEGTDDFWMSSSSGISDCIIDYPPNFNETGIFNFQNKLPPSEGTNELNMTQGHDKPGESVVTETNMKSGEETLAVDPITNTFGFGVNNVQDTNTAGIISNAFNIDTLLESEGDKVSSISGRNEQSDNDIKMNMIANKDNEIMDSQIKNTSETDIFDSSHRSNTPMTSETVPYPGSFKMNDLSHSENNSPATCDNSIVGSDTNSSKLKPAKNTQKVKKKTASKSRKPVITVGKQIGNLSTLDQQSGHRSTPSPCTGTMSPLCHSVMMQQTQLYSPISQPSENYPAHVHHPNVSDSPSQHVQSANTQAIAFCGDNNVPQQAGGNNWGNTNMYHNQQSQYAHYGNQQFQQYSNTQYQSSQNRGYSQMEQNYFDTGILPINNPYNQYYDSMGQMLTQELLQSAGMANNSPHSEFLAQNIYGQSHTQAFNNFTSHNQFTNNPVHTGQYSPHDRAASPSAPLGQLQCGSAADVTPCVDQPEQVPSFLSPTSNFVLQSQSPSQHGSQTGQEPIQAVYSNWFPSSPAYHHSTSVKGLQTIQQADIAEDLSISCNATNNAKRNVRKPTRKTKKSAKSSDQAMNNSSANAFIPVQNSVYHQGNHSSTLGAFDAYSYIRAPSASSSHMVNHTTTSASSGSLQLNMTINVTEQQNSDYQTSLPLKASTSHMPQYSDSLQQKTNTGNTQQTESHQQTRHTQSQQPSFIQNQQLTQNMQIEQSTYLQQKQQAPSVNYHNTGLESSQVQTVTYTEMSDTISNKNSAIYKESVNNNSAIYDTGKSHSDQYTYQSAKTGDTKIKLCKVPMSSKPSKDESFQQQGDLKSFWNVRKAGDCRLVFSTNKRKAEDDYTAVSEPRNHMDAYTYNASNDPYSGSSLSSGVESYQPHVKRRRYFVY